LYVGPQEAHKPELTEGRHNAKITAVDVRTGQPSYASDKLRDVLIVTFNVGGVIIKKSYTFSSNEKSRLHELAQELGFGDISKTGFSARQLVGTQCIVKTKLSEATSNGSKWDNIEYVWAIE
jgi:hypothetical protein